jgi:hypothetical protein
MMTYVWDLELVALLEVLGEGLDELLGRNVLNSNCTALVDSRKLNLQRYPSFTLPPFWDFLCLC